MRPPLFVRPLTVEERTALGPGLRSADAFVSRRCQILSASARGERAPQIAAYWGIDAQTVLDALHAFHARGRASLTKGSPRPKRTRLAFGAEQAAGPRARLQHSPRDFGHPTGGWTSDLAAEVSVATGRVATRVGGETMRQPLGRRGLRWGRAKRWITSPDRARHTPGKRAT